MRRGEPPAINALRPEAIPKGHLSAEIGHCGQVRFFEPPRLSVQGTANGRPSSRTDSALKAVKPLRARRVGFSEKAHVSSWSELDLCTVKEGSLLRQTHGHRVVDVLELTCAESALVDFAPCCRAARARRSLDAQFSDDIVGGHLGLEKSLRAH